MSKKVTIELTVNKNSYRIYYDGYSFMVKKNDAVQAMQKYPTSLNRAFELILTEESISAKNEEVLSLKEFVDRYESLVEQVRNFNTKALDREMRDNPVRNAGAPVTAESIEKSKATKAANREAKKNIPVEDDDEDIF